MLNRLTAENLGFSEQKVSQLRSEGIEATLTNNLSEIKVQQWVAEQKKQLAGKDAPAQQTQARDEQVDRILVAVQHLNFNKAAISTEQRQELKQALERVLQML